jgi:flagellar protein FlaG
MSRIDTQIATQLGEFVRPTQNSPDRQAQNQAAQIKAGAAAEAGKTPMTADQLHAAAAQLKQVIEVASSRRLSMDIDKNSKQMFMKITDMTTGEVIKQIPSEEVLSLHARLREFVGLMVDKEA